jgi:hypothetical protein
MRQACNRILIAAGAIAVAASVLSEPRLPRLSLTITTPTLSLAVSL